VEDIVDTGRSATALVKAVQEAKPASVLFATLVLKANASWNGFRPDCTYSTPTPQSMF